MNDAQKRPVALVTGGSKGIGRAICLEMARCGHDVVVNYLSDEEGAADTLAQVRRLGGDGRILGFDVRDAPGSQQAIETLLADLESLDVLVNNAGVAADGLFLMMSRENWKKVVDTTLDGFYNVTRPIIEKMIRQRRGNVVSIASVSGLMANRGQANYSAAKAGLIGASRSLAAEVARLGIRVNVVAPGLIETDMIKDLPLTHIKAMIPMARVGKPEEVARVVRFLCSEDASYISGQVIGVNGGMC
ncbi:3-oxoacyl-ACP reductase FabG [Desulfosarcina sp.]|uniref:3-oxoacyl-ACP reductase FabG n=1 Tax=Desulfosarcina sp. TaxID=2027861 RepID=UPI003970A3E4